MSKAQHKLKLIVLPAVLTIAITANYYGFYTIFPTIILHHNIGAKRQMFCVHVPSFSQQGELGEEADAFSPLELFLAALLPLSRPSAHLLPTLPSKVCKPFTAHRGKNL